MRRLLGGGAVSYDRGTPVGLKLGVKKSEANRLLYALEKAEKVARSTLGASASGGSGAPLWVLAQMARPL